MEAGILYIGGIQALSLRFRPRPILLLRVALPCPNWVLSTTNGAIETFCRGFLFRIWSTNWSNAVCTCFPGDCSTVAAISPSRIARNASGRASYPITKDRRAAEKLLHVQNEAHRLPTLNLTMARAYLSAHDAKMKTRTWAAVMREMGPHGIASSQERCARTFCSKAFGATIRTRTKRFQRT